MLTTRCRDSVGLCPKNPVVGEAFTSCIIFVVGDTKSQTLARRRTEKLRSATRLYNHSKVSNDFPWQIVNWLGKFWHPPRHFHDVSWGLGRRWTRCGIAG